MISKPSSSLAVMISKLASFSIRSHASTRLPSTRPAMVAFARPGPIDSATSIVETALSNWRVLPSGRVITGMIYPIFSGATYQVAHDKFKPTLNSEGYESYIS